MAKKGKPPAYQYYPDDFEQGTATFTLAQVGAYTRLLNHQWPHGSVPGDDLAALSRILRCTVDEAREMWSVVRTKFRMRNSVYQNPRMERERKKQREHHRMQSRRAKAGAEARWGKDRAKKSRGQQLPKGMLKHSLEHASPFPSSSTDQIVPPKPPADAGGRPLVGRARRLAEHMRRSHGRCPHSPSCQTYDQCLSLLYASRQRRAS